MTDIAITRTVDLPFQTTVEKVTEELQKEGFGVMTTIDLQAKMKEKLDRQMDKYVILGACNPALAWDAVGAVPEIGVLLPCNVCVYEQEGQVIINGMEPKAALSLLDDSTVAAVAEEASSRLHRAIAAV